MNQYIKKQLITYLVENILFYSSAYIDTSFLHLIE